MGFFRGLFFPDPLALVVGLQWCWCIFTLINRMIVTIGFMMMLVFVCVVVDGGLFWECAGEESYPGGDAE